MEQGIEQTRLNKSKPEVFSRNERRIAKFGLCAAITTAALYGLYQMFPNQPLIVAAFAALAALTLIIAFLCVLTKPAEITADGVKKLVKWGRTYSGRLSADFRTQKRVFSSVLRGQRHTCRARANARAHRSAPRPTFAHASNSAGGNSSGDGDSGQSDQGDPPGPSHSVTPLPIGSKKSNNPPTLRRRSGSYRMDCCYLPTRRWFA
jgi:hypothetical protein